MCLARFRGFRIDERLRAAFKYVNGVRHDVYRVAVRLDLAAGYRRQCLL